MGKTWRKSKTGIKYKDKDKYRWDIRRVNRSCLRHNGGCSYCEGNRLHNSRVKLLYSEMEINGGKLQ